MVDLYDFIVARRDSSGNASDLAHAIKVAVDANRSLPAVPEERVYEVDAELGRCLGVTGQVHTNDHTAEYLIRSLRMLDPQSGDDRSVVYG